MNWTNRLESLDPALQSKSQALFENIQAMGALVVAFSGGVDSSLVAAVGQYALGEKLLAVTVHSPVETPGDGAAAAALAKQVGFRHKVVAFNDLANPQFVSNPPDRCYHCKLARLQAIRQMADDLGVRWVAEGSNADDAHDYRPGARAVAELGVRSPLAEVDLSKAEVRRLSQALGLLVWDRPSAPCLATRFPYGTPISEQGLRQVAQGESFLRARGYQPVRVRHFGDTARLEVAPQQLHQLALEREEILAYFKELGFIYIMVDLAGYRSGSMNEVLKS